ncbi:MAG: tol-pal system YbgF family protein, partial [Bdellovibrionales bacterium]
EVKAIANSSVGEIYFRKGEFKTALSYYEAARRENLKNRALVEFRIAWCQLNLGRTEKAIKTLTNLLRDPELLATNTTDGKTVDPIFVKDVSGDLARFLARSKVGVREIQLLRDLSPNEARKANLYTLATETDRLGKKDASLVAWAAYVDEGQVEPNEKIEVQIRVAKIFYDTQKFELAASAFEKAVDLWKKHGCKNNDELCTELKSRMRQFVTAWNKSQKKSPTANLFRVYIAYTSLFTDDAEMLHWAAIVGRDLRRHKDAASLFRLAATQAHAELQKNPQNKTMQNIFEGSLLGEIEMAEAANDLKARESAYDYYLRLNPNGDQAFVVRYQRASVYAETNRHQEAFSEFHYLANQPGKDHRELKVKSADLALDSLVALKDDKSLEVRSFEYSRLFPERKAEYLKISRKATLNIVADNIKDTKSTDRSEYKANLALLNKMDLHGASDAEKIKYFKNKIIVAQKALELREVESTADQLLRIKSLKADDEEWAMAQKVWVADVELDFAQAYRLSTRMKLPHLSRADRELRLALLAELAGKNSRSHNEAYIRLARNTRAANLVRVTLVKESRNPWRELEKQLAHLKKTPDLLAELTLEVYARTPNESKARNILRKSSVERFAAGKTVERHLELGDFRAFDRKIRRHKIYGYSEHVMQKSLKERLNLIAQSERRAQSALKKRDWTLQVLALSQLSRENRRLYQDILRLPVPRRLKAQDRRKYEQMLKAQSEPYLQRAIKVERDLNQMWNRSQSIQSLQAAYMNASPDLQKLYRKEIQELAQNAPSGAQNRLNDLLEMPLQRPSQQDILLARKALQADPFDVLKAEELRRLEARRGQAAMVVYLDERISQLKKGKHL